jgi:hypothetical protein
MQGEQCIVAGGDVGLIARLGNVRRLTRWIIIAWSSRTCARPAGATAMIVESASSCLIRTAGMARRLTLITTPDP